MKTNEQPVMPSPDIYDQENLYMPWKKMMRVITGTMIASAPRESTVLDLMCGTGYLLGQIRQQRLDLKLFGMDNNSDYIDYASSKYPGIRFKQADVLGDWGDFPFPRPYFNQGCSKSHSPDNYIILCTGGLHHIPYEFQSSFLQVCASDLRKSKAFGIFADTCIDDYTCEQERQIAAAKLGHEYLIATIKNNAPIKVIEAATDIISNDVLGKEYKTSVKKLIPSLKEVFSEVHVGKTWPDRKISGYGEYYFIVRK